MFPVPAEVHYEEMNANYVEIQHIYGCYNGVSKNRGPNKVIWSMAHITAD